MSVVVYCFFFQAEDGIRDLVRSRGLGDVYKRQVQRREHHPPRGGPGSPEHRFRHPEAPVPPRVPRPCLLYTSDAADDLLCVDLGGRRIIKKNKNHTYY